MSEILNQIILAAFFRDTNPKAVVLGTEEILAVRRRIHERFMRFLWRWCISNVFRRRIEAQPGHAQSFSQFRFATELMRERSFIGHELRMKTRGFSRLLIPLQRFHVSILARLIR